MLTFIKYLSFQNLKHQKNRRDQFSDSNIPNYMATTPANNRNQVSLLSQEELINIEYDEHNANKPLMQTQNMAYYDQTVSI